jgi:hypothetical protein
MKFFEKKKSLGLEEFGPIFELEVVVDEKTATEIMRFNKYTHHILLQF